MPGADRGKKEVKRRAGGSTPGPYCSLALLAAAGRLALGAKAVGGQPLDAGRGGRGGLLLRGGGFGLGLAGLVVGLPTAKRGAEQRGRLRLRHLGQNSIQRGTPHSGDGLLSVDTCKCCAGYGRFTGRDRWALHSPGGSMDSTAPACSLFDIRRDFVTEIPCGSSRMCGKGRGGGRQCVAHRTTICVHYSTMSREGEPKNLHRRIRRGPAAPVGKDVAPRRSLDGAAVCPTWRLWLVGPSG